MRTIIKIVMLIGILFQFYGYPVDRELWYDGTSHPPRMIISRNVGFPIRWMEIKIIQGCTTPPHIERSIDRTAPFIDIGYWITVLWIVSKIPERRVSS